MTRQIREDTASYAVRLLAKVTPFVDLLPF
jgi:hypothetical protein